MKKVIVLFAVVFFTSAVNAEKYDYIDVGDQYMIPGTLKHQHVEVLRKLDDGKIKVRDTDSGDMQVVDASELYTKTQYDAEMDATAGKVFLGIIGAIGVSAYCDSNPGKCK